MRLESLDVGCRNEMILFGQRGTTGKQRRGMAVLAEAEQNQIEARQLTRTEREEIAQLAS